MNLLSKANIVTNNIIQASDVSQLVDAFTYVQPYDITIKGNVAIGSNVTGSGMALYIVGNTQFQGTASISASPARTSTFLYYNTGSGVITYGDDSIYLTTSSVSPGYVLFSNASGSITGSSNFTYDDINNKITLSSGKILVNTATDNGYDKLQVNGTVAIGGNLYLGNGSFYSNYTGFSGVYANGGGYYGGGGFVVNNWLSGSQTNVLVMGSYSAFIGGTSNNALITTNGPAIFINPQNTNRVVIGTTTDNGLDKLQVSGSILQTSVTSSLLKTNSAGRLIPAIGGVDYSTGSISSIPVTSSLFSASIYNTLNVYTASFYQSSYTKVGNIISVNIGGAATMNSVGSSYIKVPLPFTTSLSSQVAVGTGVYAVGNTYSQNVAVSVVPGNFAEIDFLTNQPTGSYAFNAQFTYSL